jgi:hypothetical protein
MKTKNVVTNEAVENTITAKSKKMNQGAKAKAYIAEEVTTTTEEEEKEILTAPIKHTNKPLLKNEIPPKEKPAKKEKAPKKEKTETLHRQDSVTAAIKELCKTGATMKEIMNRANEIHIAAGGESNPTATNVNRYTLFALVAFKILSVNEKGIYTLNK